MALPSPLPLRPQLYLKRYHFPTVVVMHWTRCEDGL
jgi:hypothetical protein